MKTDSAINRFFREYPGAFFTLIGEDEKKAECYEFTSIEVKEQAFRFDGVFEPKSNKDRLYFFEAQLAKKEDDFYLRFFAEVAVYLRQKKPENPWRAVVLFLTPELDPGVHPHHQEFFESGRIKRFCLTGLPDEVLDRFPLSLFRIIIDPEQTVLATAEEIIRQLPEQVHDEKEQENIIDLLINLLLSKLPYLSREEIEKMLSPLLSDVRKSRFYKEIADENKQIGKQIGKQERNHEIARVLLRKRMSLKLIAEVTGLSQTELRALKKSLLARKS